MPRETSQVNIGHVGAREIDQVSWARLAGKALKSICYKLWIQ